MKLNSIPAAKPRVSVILTTYNGATRGYLREAIDSVLRQTMEAFELVIVNDGSIDHTQEICKEYTTDKRVSMVWQDNKGLAAARNTGITISSGELICFLDDDDYWRSDKLEKQCKFMDQNPTIAMISTKLAIVNHSGEVLRYRFHKPSGQIYERQLYDNQIDAPSSVMIRRSVLQSTGMFREWLLSCEDYDLWLRVVRTCEVDSIEEPLVFYRVHDSSMSANHKRMEHYRINALYYACEADQSLNQESLYAHAFTSFFWGHLLRGNFKDARKNYWLSFAYGGPKLLATFAYLSSHFPTLLRCYLSFRRNIKEATKSLKKRN